MSVMNVKSGTKAFGNTSTAPVSDNATPAAYTPDQMKQLGGDNVGEVLNKLADSNYVDPSKKTRAVGNDKLDKDAFFKLMLAQMKNQDPTNPMKSHEMAAQLANFSSLEQMQNVNQTLTEIKAGQKPVEQFQALNFIGKAVAGDSSKLIRAKGDKEHDFPFTLPGPAKEVKIVVKNADGEVVKNFDLKGIKGGDNRIVWKGEDEKGNKAPAGEYTFGIQAVGSNGQKMAVKTSFDGTITGVNYTPEGPVLMVGNQSVRLRDVRKIVDPSLMNNDQKNSQDLKTPNAMGQTGNKQGTTPAAATQGKQAPVAATVEDEGAPDAPAKGANKIFENVGLSSEMMGKLAKETAPDTGSQQQQVASKMMPLKGGS